MLTCRDSTRSFLNRCMKVMQADVCVQMIHLGKEGETEKALFRLLRKRKSIVAVGMSFRFSVPHALTAIVVKL